jgi:hypothetical protein
MNLHSFLVGALLAAPLSAQLPKLADPVLADGSVQWFQLTESRTAVAAALGNPAFVAEFGPGMLSWQFQLGDIDHHDFSHQLVFAGDGKTLISVTRNYEPAIAVDQFFPPHLTTVHHYPDAAHPQFSVRLRRLSGERALVAIGTSRPGETTTQLVLIRESFLPTFMPWLARQLGLVKP